MEKSNMSLREPVDYIIPEQTAAVAQAAFPKGTPIMRMRDAFGSLFFNSDFAHLYHQEGAPAFSPARLALICVFQFAEGLSDAQAAHAVGARLDWKYALALPLTAPPLDSSLLCDFRSRLIDGSAELLLFETLIERFSEQGLLRKRGRMRTDATHVLAAIRTLGRLECLGQTLRLALNTLASLEPAWLRRFVPESWFVTYAQPFTDYRLPEAKDKRIALAEQIGLDGRYLLEQLSDPHAPPALLELPAVQVLQAVWTQQFYPTVPEQPLRLRKAEDLPPSAELICSPIDAEARFSIKRETTWVGYKVHLTETCEAEQPNLICDVQTTVATRPDSEVLPQIQAALKERGLPPAEQVLDSGYMSADNLVSSQSEQIELVGPVRGEGGWQTRVEEGVRASQFVIDWEAREVRCPAGKSSRRWSSSKGRKGQEQISVVFDAKDCGGCELRERCVASKRRARAMTLQPQAQYEALRAARERQQSEQFSEQYRVRAGIEGTIGQGSRLADLHRSRYRGLAKTSLLHILIACALNFLRVAAWLAERPRAQTRQSAFARLASLPI
jgi:transposase